MLTGKTPFFSEALPASQNLDGLGSLCVVRFGAWDSNDPSCESSPWWVPGGLPSQDTAVLAAEVGYPPRWG